MYILKRTQDGKGAQGNLSIAIEWNDDDTFKARHDGPPRLGCSMLVGTNTTSNYWLTTVVTDILEDTGNCVKFKTKNSEYEWKTIV